jgi:hypothetical protein
MPDENPPTPQVAPEPQPPSEQPVPGAMSHIQDEFGTASKNLPPAKIVLIGVGAVVAVALIFALLQKPHSSATGNLSDVTVVEIPGQNAVMVAINVSLHNGGTKPFWIHTMRVDLDANGNNLSDEAAPAVDFDRYFQAFPALKQNAKPALKRETMIPPGSDLEGTIMVSFPVTQDAFNSRKELKVTIQPYDQPVPLVLSK